MLGILCPLWGTGKGEGTGFGIAGRSKGSQEWHKWALLRGTRPVWTKLLIWLPFSSGFCHPPYLTANSQVHLFSCFFPLSSLTICFPSSTLAPAALLPLLGTLWVPEPQTPSTWASSKITYLFLFPRSLSRSTSSAAFSSPPELNMSYPRADCSVYYYYKRYSCVPGYSSCLIGSYHVETDTSPPWHLGHFSLTGFLASLGTPRIGVTRTLTHSAAFALSSFLKLPCTAEGLQPFPHLPLRHACSSHLSPLSSHVLCLP